MKKNLLIFTHGGGRLANQMTNHAHLIAFQREYHESFDVMNLAISAYSSLFQKMQSKKIQYISEGSKRLQFFSTIIGLFVASREVKKKTLFNQIIRFIHTIFFLLPFSQSIKYGTVPNYLPFLPGKSVSNLDLGKDESILILKRKNITALAGWPIRSWKLFEKHQNLIRSSFTISDKYKINAEKFIAELRQKYDFLIGVFIRQDDYRYWAEGKYFFETDQYIDWMRQVEILFPQKKTGFVIASNEKQEFEQFHSPNIHFSTGLVPEKGIFIESFAELSLCDYIMTPPSTYGVWAAFLGDKPIIPLYERNQTIVKEDFLKNNLFDSLHHPHMSVSIK